MRSASAKFKWLEENNKDSRLWEDGKTNGWRQAVKKFVDMSDMWEAKAEELARALEDSAGSASAPCSSDTRANASTWFQANSRARTARYTQGTAPSKA